MMRRVVGETPPPSSYSIVLVNKSSCNVVSLFLVSLIMLLASSSTTSSVTKTMTAFAFSSHPTSYFGVGRIAQRQQHQCVLSSNSNEDDDKVDSNDEESANLTAELFKLAQEKGINIDDGDFLDDEDEDDDEEDEEDDEEPNIPQGAINAFLGYDTGDVGEKLAGNVSLTDDQLYSEVKERVLDTAGGFVQLVGGASDDDDDDDSGDADADGKKKYLPPTTVPDSDLTAGEVVILVLEALNNNDVPTVNRGVEILFGYSSPGSQIKNEEGLTPAEYSDFLKETTEYKVLFDHQEVVIDKADYSFDGKKAFFTARLRVGPGALDFTSVNFILSKCIPGANTNILGSTAVAGNNEDDDDNSCWLIDSLLIRPSSMRRRRRK